MEPFQFLRLLVGLPLVLFLPGWAWSLAAFPRSRPMSAERTEPGQLDLLERGAVSLALSVALVSLGALLWNGALRLPLGVLGSCALLTVLTGSGLAAARWRARRVS